MPRGCDHCKKEILECDEMTAVQGVRLPEGTPVQLVMHARCVPAKMWDGIRLSEAQFREFIGEED